VRPEGHPAAWTGCLVSAGAGQDLDEVGSLVDAFDLNIGKLRQKGAKEVRPFR
jgi:hypothetical protein